MYMFYLRKKKEGIKKNDFSYSLIDLKWNTNYCFLFQDTSVSLIKMGQFEVLKMLLEPTEFQSLKPLLLLHGWSYCHSCQTAKQLLDALWNDEV